MDDLAAACCASRRRSSVVAVSEIDGSESDSDDGGHKELPVTQRLCL
jgi:hypothetical protein